MTAPVDPRLPALAAETVDGLVEALSAAVGFAPGGKPDYEMIRGLCLEGCIFLQPPRGHAAPKPVSTEDFIARFEARLDPASATPIGRGVDRLHLVRHDGRWWIASIVTEYEGPGKPLPEEYLAPARAEGKDTQRRRR